MSISENLKTIQGNIAKAAKAHGRAAEDVRLIAVSKNQSDETIEAALAAGQRIFGENRVQEAQAHWAARRKSAAYDGLELHLIGPLQTNKVKDALALFDVIQTLDREKLARALAKEMEKQGRNVPCFIQVNTGEEEQKAGISLIDLPDFHSFCVGECGLNIVGLMCIPPVDEPPALHFALLARAAQDLGLSELSMGMSSDYEKAVALGARYVRVGTSLFGAR